MKRKFSLITIHYGRKSHLRNLISGLLSSSVHPDELIIISINDSFNTSEMRIPFIVNNYRLKCNPSEGLPLSKARNLGAMKAIYDDLIFLDVDCVPSKYFIEKIKLQSALYDGLIMGNPRYLIKSLPDYFDEYYLMLNSIHHPHRPEIDFIEQISGYEMFWSLCFYIHKKQYQLWEGFDERYKGYGAEDTDFALKAKDSNCPFYVSDATVYHQPHQFHRPPLNHFSSIVHNSNLFFEKWNKWPMENYLADFKNMKLIEWQSHSDREIYIRKYPSKKALQGSLVINEPFA